MSFAFILVGLVFTAIEYTIISFIVKKTGVYQKLLRPPEVVALIIIELVGLAFLLKDISLLSPVYLAILIAFLLVKMVGLWTLKKWVLVAYVIPGIGLQFVNVTNVRIQLDLPTVIIGILSQSLILIFYYLNVYRPNRTLFK